MKIWDSIQYAFSLSGYNFQLTSTQKEPGLSDNLKPFDHIQEIFIKANQRIDISHEMFHRTRPHKS